jgi:hypothetical protein
VIIWTLFHPEGVAGTIKYPSSAAARRKQETGCGGSTMVLSNAGEHHIAFAIEGKNRTISKLRK